MKKILILLILLTISLISSCSYIDDIIEDYKTQPQYDPTLESVYSMDELVERYQKLQVDYESTLSLNLKFDYDDLQEIVDELNQKSLDLFNFSSSFEEYCGVLTIKMDYLPFSTATTSYPNLTIVQNTINYHSLYGFTKTRSDDFDDFKINERELTYQVNNSESLYYVMQEGYNPIIDESNQTLVKLYNEIKKIARNIINDDMDDLTKCLVMYEYITSNIVYDKNLLEIGRKDLTSSVIYDGYNLEGAVFNHKCVCSGYAKLFACLCALENIPCRVVNGKTVATKEGHSWNKVCIDGNWYIVDITNGAISSENQAFVNHKYFLMKDIDYFTYAIEDNITSEYRCTTDFNIYEYLKYQNHSLYLNSYIDTYTLFQALLLNKKLTGESISVDVYFNYSLTNNDIAQELNKLFRDLLMLDTYSYVTLDEHTYIIIF